MEPSPLAADRAAPKATGWFGFWFAASDPLALHVVRFLLGVVILYWLASIGGQYRALVGLDGWLDRRGLVEVAQLPSAESRPLGWSPAYLARPGWLLTPLYFAGLLAAILFTLGIATRVTGIATWLTVITFSTSPVLWNGGDALLQMAIFYVALGCLLDRIEAIGRAPGSLLGPRDGRVWRWRRSDLASSIGANLALRLLQVHLAIALFTTGMHKLQMAVWWSGEGLWFPIHSPLAWNVDQIRQRYPNPGVILGIISLLTYAMIAWQITFPFVAWRRAWRPVILVGAMLGWMGNLWIFQLPLFGPVILIGSLAFVPGATWRRWLAWVNWRSDAISTGSAKIGGPMRGAASIL